MYTIPLTISTKIPVAAGRQPVTVGIPLPRGMARPPFRLTVGDGDDGSIPLQCQSLAEWPDGSIKWLLVDFILPELEPGQTELPLYLHPGTEGRGLEPGVQVRDVGDSILVDTGAAQFEVRRGEFLPFRAVRAGGSEICDIPATESVLTDRKGRRRTGRVNHTEIETAGPVRTTLAFAGVFEQCRGLRFRARISFYSGTGLVHLRLTIHNPNRARHRGGIWDLGDPGSLLFRDLSLGLRLAEGNEKVVRWKADAGESFQQFTGRSLEIYQDSSGGENWRSRNHVNRKGRVPCRFRGYEVQGSGTERRGQRASPVVALENAVGSVAASLSEFWQQFPKAIEVEDHRLIVRLFPNQWDDLFELQGGERKSHTLWLRFASHGTTDADDLEWTHAPAVPSLAPEWYAAAGVVPQLSPAASDPDDRLQSLMQGAVASEKSLLARREVIDECGWRNYGDVWADHEAVYYRGPQPVISHYNNQFDVVFGAIIQWMRTGDPTWRDLWDPLARHVMDIDIYHTEADRAAYSGGLFWFTDHYLDAATSTHRTYSRSNAASNGGPYGGGPGAEHNFATGLLYYYYLTGDPDGREAVLGLADWVIRMDDGALNILGLVDRGPTGRATPGKPPLFHGASRGGANSVSVLLDAWLLSQNRMYLIKAEELIRRCIHPADEIDRLDLLNAEVHWSYTMFLSSLARYLDIKAEHGEIDECYAYAQQSLLHYAAWMVQYERPYLDHPQDLEYPTEAWAAQEFRKANVLRLAACHADSESAAAMRRRGDELSERAWKDLMSFRTYNTARALAVLMIEGARDAALRGMGPAPAPRLPQATEFGRPEPFIPQKARVLALLRSPTGATSAVLGLMRCALAKLLQPITRMRPRGAVRPEEPAVSRLTR